MNYEDAEKIIEGFEELQKLAAPVATQMMELNEGKRTVVDPEEIELDGGSLYANTSLYIGCGDYEDYKIYIPLEYIFDDGWQETMRADIQRKREEKEREKRLKLEKAQKAEKARRREQYLKLQAEFEGEANEEDRTV